MYFDFLLSGEVTRKGGATSNTNSTLVYASAALGVVHDLATNKQKLFAGHTNDITCITLSNSGSIAATGQTGKDAVVHIWSTASTPKRTQRARSSGTIHLFLFCACSDTHSFLADSQPWHHFSFFASKIRLCLLVVKLFLCNIN